jgi:hypothetical protein
MFALSAMARLVLNGAERDGCLRSSSSSDLKACINLLATIVSYIVDNNYYLIDVTGKRTFWGVWNPDELNNQYVLKSVLTA